MAEKIRCGDYTDFGKLLHLCAYIPKETFLAAEKLGYEKEYILPYAFNKQAHKNVIEYVKKAAIETKVNRLKG